MKKEDFTLLLTLSGEEQYLHVENGKKREQLLRDKISGKITNYAFITEQKKMRNGKYLKYIYTKKDMEDIINERPKIQSVG